MSKDNSEVDLKFQCWHGATQNQSIIVRLLLCVSSLETMETEEDGWTTVHRGKRR